MPLINAPEFGEGEIFVNPLNSLLRNFTSLVLISFNASCIIVEISLSNLTILK